MGSLFTPRLYVQRHDFVVDFVTECIPKKVLDLGCADCRLLKKLKLLRNIIELLVGVDVDSAVILDRVEGLGPLLFEHLQPHERPLTIELYQGSVTEREPCTQGFDLVTCLELIEHLEPSKVDMFSDVVFGYMAPKAVIVSTPNAEFNSLLPILNGFRHPSHRFEWTRMEFQTWATEACRKHGYSVEFAGVGLLPGQDEDIGFCSQIGVFRRDAEVQILSRPSTSLEPTVYKLLHRVVYPSLQDPQIFQRTLLSTVLGEAAVLKRKWEAEEQVAQPDSILLLDGLLEAEREVEELEASGEEEEEEEEEEPMLFRHGRWVCVPLQCVLDSPRVRRLCGDIQSLREALAEDPRVRLDADTSAIMLSDDDDEEEEEEDDEELAGEDEEEASKMSMLLVNEEFDTMETTNEEDWEAELF